MSYKKFDSSKILKSENPFPSTRATSICNGTFIREIFGNYLFDIDVQTSVKCGLLKKLIEHYESSKESDGKYKPCHLLILADYGQGKTLALRYLQDKIHATSYDVIISKSISNEATIYLNNENAYLQYVLKQLKEAYVELINNYFPNKSSLLDNIKDTEEAQYQLMFFDNAFALIDTRVFICLDELDKILEVNYPQGIEINQKSFLEELKIIAECCKKSISLWIAGTPQCIGVINQFGRDYKERFDTIMSTFNEEDTIKYINKKCTQKLKYIGYIPFTNDVKKEIFKYSYGKIRYVNSFCKDLWNISSDEKIKIDINKWKTYIKTKFEEPIKVLFGNNVRYSQIELLSKLISKDKVSSIEIYLNKNLREKQEIQNFIDKNIENQNIVKIKRSYKLNSNIKEQLVNKVFGD